MAALAVLAGLFFGALALLLTVVSRSQGGPQSAAPWSTPPAEEVEQALHGLLSKQLPVLASPAHPALTEVARQLSYGLVTGAVATVDDLEDPPALLRRLHPTVIAATDTFVLGPFPISGPDPQRAAEVLRRPLADALPDGGAADAHGLAVALSGNRAVVACCFGSVAGALAKDLRDDYSLLKDALALEFLPQTPERPLRARLQPEDGPPLDLDCLEGRRPDTIVLTMELAGVRAGAYVLEVDGGSGWMAGPRIVLA